MANPNIVTLTLIWMGVEKDYEKAIVRLASIGNSSEKETFVVGTRIYEVLSSTMMTQVEWRHPDDN